MKKDSKVIQEKTLQKNAERNQEQKKLYTKPSLVSYGDVRDITLGVSSFGFESGSGGTRCDKGIPTIPPCP